MQTSTINSDCQSHTSKKICACNEQHTALSLVSQWAREELSRREFTPQTMTQGRMFWRVLANKIMQKRFNFIQLITPTSHSWLTHTAITHLCLVAQLRWGLARTDCAENLLERSLQREVPRISFLCMFYEQHFPIGHHLKVLVFLVSFLKDSFFFFFSPELLFYEFLLLPNFNFQP